MRFAGDPPSGQHGVFAEQTIPLGGKLRLGRNVSLAEVTEAESLAVMQRQRVLNTLAPAPGKPAQSPSKSPQPPSKPVPPGQKAAQDPVCGMTVDPATAPRAMYQGKTYHFCSAEDRLKFIRNPEAYLKKQPGKR